MQALSGLRIVDFSHALAGPFCTHQLGMLGAEIIKVERPEIGDDFRLFGRVEGVSVGLAFLAINAGKKSVVVDLKTEEGMANAVELVRTADVVVENFRPGVADKLGLGWEEMSRIKPDLIYCSISGFGQTGAMKDWPAYDHTIKAVGGMSWTGAEDDVPDQGRGFSVDCFTGYVGFAAILSALLRRERTGFGQRLDVSMLDSSLILQSVGLVRQAVTADGKPAYVPIVHDRPTVGAFETKDGWIWLSVNYQNQWEKMCNVIGGTDLLTDPQFADRFLREQNAAALRAELEVRLRKYSSQALEELLMDAGCPAARVRTSMEAMEIESLHDRGMVQSVSFDAATFPLFGSGFITDADGPHIVPSIPALGEHTDEILSSLGEGTGR